jgi:hypothetical protein
MQARSQLPLHCNGAKTMTPGPRLTVRFATAVSIWEVEADLDPRPVVER